MAILEKEIQVYPQNSMPYYKSLGYEMPSKTLKREDRTIVVKVSDLPKGSNKIVTKACDFCGKHIPTTYNAVIRYRKNGKDRCHTCATKDLNPYKNKKIKIEETFEYYALKKDKKYLLREFSYKNKKKPNEIRRGEDNEYLWFCFVCRSEYPMVLNNKLSGYGCPFCSGHRVNHTNCLWVTHPEVASLLKYQEIGHQISRGSHRMEEFICDRCNLDVGSKNVSSVVYRGLSCPRCSDGVSYPEKFFMKLLIQLKVDFERQKTFSWSKTTSNNRAKRYDFYIPNKNCIVEVHGNQHYEEERFSPNHKRTLKEEQENDELKERLAIKNGIEHYVVIDCRKSELKWIKNSILDSELSGLFNLKSINWSKCHKYACNSLVKEASELWSNGMKSTLKIGEKMGLHSTTVLKYLKQGRKVGWCDYNPEEVMRNIGIKASSRNKKEVIQFSLDGKYIKEWSSVEEIEKILGFKRGGVYNNLQERAKSSHGFKWVYKDNYKQKEEKYK